MALTFATAEDRPVRARKIERSASDRRFRTAARHSRRVRLMRVAIPVGIILCVGVFALAAYFNPLRMLAKLPIDPSKISISGTKVTIDVPRLAGYTRDRRSYDMTAKAAAYDISKPDVLELRDVHAKIEMQDKSTVELTAANGLYDRKADQLTLLERIVLVSTTGYQAFLSHALIDVKAGSVTSDNPVEVRMTQGTLNANRMDMADQGDVMVFDGGVTMNLVPENPPAKKSAK